MKTQKILIIGISGTGKSRLARKLSELLDIPTTYLDSFIWNEHWKENNEKNVIQKLEDVLKNEKWIIEGFIHPSATPKLQKADLVLYLDYSGPRAFLGGLKRWWQYRGKARPEMPNGCIERFDWNFLKVMWKRAERPEIEEAIKGFEKKIIRLKSWKETDSFLDKKLKE